MDKKYHFIGIGGIGMSGLAHLLLQRGCSVSGSDIAENALTAQLRKEGAEIHSGHSAVYVSPAQTIVFSSGIKNDNPEFRAAVDLKCAMRHRSQILEELMQGYRSLAVAGTHGKTTTSALLSWVLDQGALDPSFAVGGVLPHYGSNAKQGKGDYFVAEADESDGSFLNYHPFGAIVTNIGLDHMDHYHNEEGLIRSFQRFIAQVKEPQACFWCGDDVRLVKLSPKGVSYGFGESSQLRAVNFLQKGWGSVFDLIYGQKQYLGIETALIGRHNVLNAAAVFGLALSLGVDEQKIRKALATFSGVGRRMEKKGEVNGILFIDDYAHHPTEVKTTLEGLRKAIGGRRLICIFQPHRYSRTKDCLGEFGKMFDAVDLLLIPDIYAAGEAPIPGITRERIVQEVRGHSKAEILDVARDALAAELVKIIRPGDTVVTMGAGNVTKLAPEIMEKLKCS